MRPDAEPAVAATESAGEGVGGDVPDAEPGLAATETPEAGAVATCAACGEQLVAGASFCEACGAPAGGAHGAGPTVSGPTASGPAAAAQTCAACGGEIDGDGYCTTCGRRAPDPVTVDDRGALAFATHRGRRYPRNEDAAALAATAEGWPVLVVSDGVSASPNPHQAAAAAVAAAAAHLAGRPFAGGDDLVAAVEAAHAAASVVPAEGDPQWAADGSHPACTLAVAVATPTEVHAANVGDARVHTLTPDGDTWVAAQVSTDDSVAAHAVAKGVEVEVALELPGGHGITAWLGADAPALHPHVATRPVEPGTLVLACSDGLWNYAPTDAALAGAAAAAAPLPGPATSPGASLAVACERLVVWANEQGGADNVTVALAAVPGPAAPAPEPGPAAPAPEAVPAAPAPEAGPAAPGFADPTDPTELEDT